MIMNDRNRTKTRIAVYLVGLRQDKILLGKRKNADFLNEHWSLVAGHVYEGESCINAIIRETQEECGIALQPHELKLIGAMHHNSLPYDYMNFIYTADLTNHNPVNAEEEKCESLDFFPLSKLPDPIAPYVLDIIKKSCKNEYWIAEVGWE